MPMGILKSCHWILLSLMIFAWPSAALSTSAGEEEETEAESGFEGVWGISVQPKAFWFGRMLGADEISDNPLKYHMKPNAFTTYEGGFWHEKSGLRLGVSAGMDDNVVGDLYDFMISAGYKGLLLRMQSGAISGEAEWEGVATPQTPRRISFKSEYTNVDVLWDWGLVNPARIEDRAHGMYLGIGYASLKAPVLVRWAEDRWRVKGVDIYQERTQVYAYSLVFGQENMSPAFLYRAPGPWWWFQYDARIGYFSNARLRQETLDLMSQVNPDMPKASQNIPLFFSEFEFLLGAQYVAEKGSLKYALGAGYSVMGGMFTGEKGSGLLGLNPKGEGIDLYTGFTLWRHGPVIKALARW